MCKIISIVKQRERVEFLQKGGRLVKRNQNRNTKREENNSSNSMQFPRRRKKESSGKNNITGGLSEKDMKGRTVAIDIGQETLASKKKKTAGRKGYHREKPNKELQ